MARKTAFDLRNEYDKSKHNKASDNTYSTFAKTQSILGDSKTYMDTQSDYRKNVANNQLAYIEEQKRRKEERIEQQMRYDAMDMIKTGRSWYKPGDFQQANKDINPSSDTMKAVNNVYAAYRDTEDVESAKKRADEARKNLENVARIAATMQGDYAKAYSGYLNDHANYYKQASEGMDDLKDIYGYYKTEKAYNDAKKEQELKDKYAGFSYDQIKAEKAKLDPDSEEYRFLDNYRENVGYSTEKDYEKAIEDLSENKPGKEQKIYATWEKISDDYSYEDVKRIVEANENNDIDSLFDDYTEDQIGDVISAYTFAAMDVEENYFDETQDLKRDQETFKKEHAFERYYNSVVANSDFPILSQYDYDPMQNTRIVSGKEFNYSDKGSNEKDLKQVYDYMNTDPDKIDELWTFGFAADYKEKGYAFATEKEKEVFNYLYNSRDLDKARSYLKEMEPIWTQRREQYGDSLLSEYYDNANLGEKALLNIGASGLNILGGVQSGANMVGALVSGKDYNPYSALGEASRLSSNIRKETGEEIAKNTSWEIAGRNVGQFAYNTLASTLDSATGVALLGPGYAAVASGNVFNQTAEQMMGKGYSQTEIWLTAGSAALAEALFEKYSIDKLVNIPKTTGFKNILKASLKQGGIEASEEVFTEISNLLTDSFFRAGTSDIKTMYDEYIRRGYTEEEAKNEIQKEIIARITEAGLGGFFSGGIMGGFQSTTQFLGNKKTADSVSVNTYNEILDAAKNMDGKLKKIADQVENAEDLSTEQKIEILDALSEAQTNEVKESIKDELVDNGIDAEVADKMSEVISENVASDTNELKSKIEQITNDENDIQMAMDAVKSIKDGAIDLPITQAVQKVNQDIKDAREEKATREERSEAKKDFEDSQLTETQEKYAKAKGTAKITTSSGESLTVYGFKVAAGMNSKLKTAEGRTVSFKDASFEDETMQALYQEASRLSDVELINVALKSYKGQQNIKGYVDTINYAFDAGKISNQTNETFEKFAENKANKLLINNIGNDNYVVSKAFELGQKFVKTEEAKNAQKRKNTSNAEKITQGENELRKIEAALSDILGKEINEVEGIKDKNGNYNKAIQGQSKRNLIEINKNGRDRYKTLIHETMETMKKDNAKGYERLKKDVLEYIVETRGNKELQDTLRSYQIAYAKVGDSGAIQDVTDEFFNNVVAGLFSQERGIDQLVSWAKNNISNRFGQFLEDIADFFKKAAEEIKEFLKVNDADMSSAEKLGYQIEMNKANELRSQILEELVNVKENVDETERGGGEEEINYSMDTEEQEYKEIAKKAEKHFGTTLKFDLAGYIDLNGKLLDFSENQGYRVQDYREISEILELPEDAGYSDGLIEFMRQGNIRLQSYGIDLSVKPNSIQKKVLREFFNKLNGEVTVDYSKINGDNAGTAEYSEGTSSTRILNDIDKYFETGEVPKGTDDGNVYFSLDIKELEEKTLSERLEDALLYPKKYENSRVYIGETSDKLIDILKIKKLPMLITKNHVYSTVKSPKQAIADGKVKLENGTTIRDLENKYHGLGITRLANALKELENPIIIVKSSMANEDTDFFVVTSQKTSDTKTVIVPVAIKREGFYNSMNILHNQAKTTYAKNDLMYILNKAIKENRILYIDKKNSHKITDNLGDTFSNIINNYDYTDSLNNYRKIVNMEKTLTSEQISEDYDIDVDSEGRELSEQQEEYFKDSLVRDDKGNLLVMYHGTPNALFSVFRGGSYFTPYKWYADKYQNMGASSISIKTKAEKPGTYEVYLDIKKPFDTRIPEVKKIWDEQYYRQWGTGTPLMESGLPDWTDGLDLVEFIEENELDFDGIILDEGATGGYGEEVKSRGFSWIPLNANQIKSVNNTNPTEENDINFSVDTYAFEVWEEIANSEELKAASEIIAKASENLKNAKLDEAKVRKIASDIIKENRSTMKVDDLTQSLAAVFSYITEEADANYDVLLQIMKDIATPVLENSKAMNSAAEIEWKNMRDYLKGMKVKLSYKQKKEVESTYDSYDNYRRSLWGTIAFDEKNGTSLDSLWSEIVDKSGGRLDIMEADTNQPQALKEMIDSMKPGAYNEFGMDKEHAAFDVAMDIYRRFFIMEDEYRNNKKVKDEVEKLIKKQQEIRYKTGQKYQEKLKEVQAELKYQKARNIKELAARISQLTAEERELLAEDEIGKALIQAERLAYEKKLKALKESNDKKIAEIKAKNQQSKENQREKKKATNLRHDLKSQIDQLNKMLKSPTKDAHVKNTLVRPTIALLEAINMDTGKSKNLKEKLQQLRYMYEAYKNDQKFEFDYDENTAKMIADMELLFEGRDYTQLTNEELDQVIKIVQRLKRQIQNANKILQNEKLEDAKKTRKNIIDEIDSAKAPKNAAQEMLDKYLSMHLNAKRWARKIVGYKDGAFTELFRHLDEGQMKSMQIMKEIDKIFEPVLSGKENQKNVKQLTSIDDKDLVDVGLKNGKDEKVLITKEMRLSLILHTMNRDNMYHILFGGMTVPDLKYYHAGKFQEAYRRGDTYRFNQYYDTLRSAAIEAAKRGTPELLDKVVDDISKELRNGLMNQLNDYEKEFLQKAETMFHVYTGAVINEVSNELKGYSLASVKNYFPIKTDPDFTRTEFANLIQDRTIEGWGSLKSRIRSRNQLLMEGLSNVILRETENVSRYAGFAIPVRNVNMLLGQNVYDGSQTKSIKHSLRKKWGDSNLKWFENLMKDIQGGRMQDSNVFDDLRSKFAGATLNLNISVAMKQAASFPTAAAKLGHKPIIKAIKDIQKGFVKKQGIKELEEINPLLHYREKGLISQEFADVKSKRRLGEKISNLPGMNWIQFMDLGTVRTLEYASQYYVDDNFKDLKKGSQEYWKKVSEVFTEVVEETQPNYTVMQQADITRNPNRFLKQLFMFKTQPLQNLGLVYDALGEFSAVMRDTKGFKEKNLSKEEVAKIEKDRKRVSENVSWAVSSMLVQAAVFNTMTLLAKALLHKKPWDEEDEEYANKDYIEQLMINYKNGMTDVFLGSLLGGAEIKNALDTWFLDKTYYDVNVSVLDTYNDLVDNVKYMKQSIEAYNNAVTEADIEKARIKIVNNGIKLLNVIGTASGVPVNNAMNLFKSGYMFTKDIVTGSPLGSSTMLDVKAVDTMYQRIEEAILDADWNRVEDLRVQLVKASEAADPEQKTKENIRDKAIKEAFVAGEITKEQASEALEKIGYDDEQIVKYLSKWINLRTQNELGEEATLDEYIESAKESGIDNSSQIKSQVKEDIQNGEITEKEAIDYLVKAGYEKNEAYFEVQKMEYDKMYGHLLSEISSQAKSGKANQKTLNDIVKEYTEHGKDKSDVASAITSNFKSIYLESKGAEKTNLYAILLKAYQSCGLTRKEAEERIKKWK